MALHADVFEPKTIFSILKSLEPSEKKGKFEATWNLNVGKRVESWKKKPDNSSTPMFQLQWEAQVVEYVNYLHSKLSVHGNASASAKETPRTIGIGIPFLGPRFVPPGFLHYMRRDATPAIKPEYAYIAAITIVHPVFYPNILTDCPRCASSDIRWDSWNSTGARSVYGVRVNERALGYQLRCKNCKANNASGTGGAGYCVAATSSVFWSKWEHWNIPRSIPYFLKRAAVTHELFDLIIELRPSSTSAGLSENIKQLHLLEYKQRMLEYLSYFKSAKQNPFRRNNLLNFSSPTDEQGYNDAYITNELITDLYLDFVAKGRKSESVEYCKTRTAKSLSMDNTFKSAGKASIIEGDGRRQNPMKGGILSAINEEGEGLSWRYCMSNSPAEARELLQDIGRRHDAMDVPRPSSIIVDNCCAVRRYVIDGLGAGTFVLLDIYHFMMRYGAVIFQGTKNPHRREVLLDIRNAVIKTPAKANQPATYWTQPEQEERIIDAYNKWLQHGDVWSAAASKVHADQLEHVRKGCLARPREDISMDGSRIEGSHKAWNSLQRAQPSGIEVYTALAHDFFLRRNIRVATVRVENNRTVNFSAFILSAHSSHHINLVNHTARLFNNLYELEPPASKGNLSIYPILPQVKVTEMIGLVESTHSVTFGGFIDAKVEESEQDPGDTLLEEIDAVVEETGQTRLIQSLEVDERLISVMMGRSSLGPPPMNSVLAPTAVAVSSGQVHAVSSSTGTSVLTTPNTPSASTSTATIQSQKRKEYTDSASEEPRYVDDSTPDSKHRRYTGPLSPSTLALGFSGTPPPESDFELDQTPEPQDSVDGMALVDCEPTDAVVSDDIALPSTPSTRGSELHAFFRFQAPQMVVASSSSTEGSHSQPTLDALRRPLPLPSSLRDKGLTRSQLLFSIGTSIDPRALRITGDDEFYLFMDMRTEFQWTSFGMTASKWAPATKIYNSRLAALGQQKNIEVIKKNPRALMDKLNEIEPRIVERILKQDFNSNKGGTDTFWKKHCAAVPALVIKTEGRIDSASNGLSQKKRRKDAVCTRCKATMYVGEASSGLNHKRGICADGVPSKQKPGSALLPDWPQPQGIFINGKFFNASKFLVTVRDLYEKVIEHAAQGADDPIDSQLEDEAFSRMLKLRTIFIEGHAYFHLYDGFALEGGSYELQPLVSVIEGKHYLRMDCL